MSKKKRQKKYKPRVIERNITVTSELHDMPDFRRLVRAVTLLARQQMDLPPKREVDRDPFDPSDDWPKPPHRP